MVFVKGQSGNPNGRKPGESPIKILAQEKSPQAFAKIIGLLNDNDSKVVMQAAKEILDRAWGKPAQGVELSNSDGTPLQAALHIIQKAKDDIVS